MDLVISGILIAALVYLVLLVLMGTLLLLQAVVPKIMGRRQHAVITVKQES